MTYPNPDPEAALETATLALFQDLGWRTLNAYHEVYADAPGGQRGPVYLARDRSAMTPAHANREIYQFLKEDLPVTLRDPEGEERTQEVFGEYVTVYNYKQSNEDNATVPLYYENRTPSAGGCRHKFVFTTSSCSGPFRSGSAPLSFRLLPCPEVRIRSADGRIEFRSFGKFRNSVLPQSSVLRLSSVVHPTLVAILPRDTCFSEIESQKHEKYATKLLTWEL